MPRTTSHFKKILLVAGNFVFSSFRDIFMVKHCHLALKLSGITVDDDMYFFGLGRAGYLRLTTIQRSYLHNKSVIIDFDEWKSSNFYEIKSSNCRAICQYAQHKFTMLEFVFRYKKQILEITG